MNTRIMAVVFGVLSIALCDAVYAQPGKIARIGFLDSGTASGMAVLVDAFRQELSNLGWIEGKMSPSSIDLQRVGRNFCPNLQHT